MILNCHSSAGSYQPQKWGKGILDFLSGELKGVMWSTFFKYNLLNNFSISLKIRTTLRWSHVLYLRYWCGLNSQVLVKLEDRLKPVHHRIYEQRSKNKIGSLKQVESLSMLIKSKKT